MPKRVSQDFWGLIQELVNTSKVVIDRPKNSRHPDYPERSYPYDYGYLAGTMSPDGGGIDVWVGTGDAHDVVGIICTVDLTRRETEIIVLLGCNDDEMQAVFEFLDTESMGCILFRRRPD
ncbi:MAG: inorganic pyrophosphatase [Chloroflexi bacterium]|nr:MAG: inorganic pyrophosphatase [Chloroflexota bacterium]